MKRLFIVLNDEDVVDRPIFIKQSQIQAIVSGGAQTNPQASAILQDLLDSMQNSLRTALTTFDNDRPDLEVVVLSQKSYMDNLRANSATKGIVEPFTQNVLYSAEFNTQAGKNFPNPPWPVDKDAPVLNAKNLLYIDDIHYTEHTAKLIADIACQWF